MTQAKVADLATLLGSAPALVLSGAGISTDSGIPDYRSPAALENPREPMRIQEFVRSEEARRRYWARSHAAWPRMRAVKPNAGHAAVARLEHAGAITGVLTQNVDGLHQHAGSRNVLELHGSLARVRCLDCGAVEAMAGVQQRLAKLNPRFDAAGAALNPDGDAELSQQLEQAFRPATCLVCGGVIRTDVVFFGENVAAPDLERAWKMLDEAAALLVLGSSLTVRSGFRFVEEAARRQLPIAIVNRGPTRGDDLADLRMDAALGEVLPALAEAVGD